MFGSIFASRKSRRVRKYRRLPLRLEILERREQPAGLAAAIGITAFAPGADTRSFAGLTPAIVRQAYGFNQLNLDGSGETIAIVSAFDQPNIGKDLQIFDSAFGLNDPPSLTTASIPGTPSDPGWAVETSLDVEWAHAMAPGANLLLVESPSNSLTDMMNAVDFARSQPDVSVVSMSWGLPEFLGQTQFDYLFSTPLGHQPVTFVASSGDSGAADGVMWPASSPNVLAVGGTSLQVTSSGAIESETAWSGATGGFSRVYTTGGGRQVPDVAYAADPGTGFLVYDSVPTAKGQSGWFRVGGTSAGAPQWAGLVADADQSRALVGEQAIANARAAVMQASSAAFNDVTTGSNGYIATVGKDLVTGRGSPDAPVLVAQLTKASQPAPIKLVGPIAAPTLTTKTTARVPLSESTLALVEAAVASENAARAALLMAGASSTTPAPDFSQAQNSQNATLPPVVVPPPMTTNWEQSERTDSGAAHEDPPIVPALPDGPVSPVAPPGGVNVVAPPSATMVEAVDVPVLRVAATKARGAKIASAASTVASLTADYGTGLWATALCFLGGCFVGIEPRKAERRRPGL